MLIRKYIFHFHPCSYLSCYPSRCLCIDILCIAVIWEAFHFSLFCTLFYSCLLIYFASHMAHAMPMQSYATSVLQAKTGNSWSYGKGGVCLGLSASLFCFWESLIPSQTIFFFLTRQLFMAFDLMKWVLGFSKRRLGTVL